jgi:hypothetical protein
MIGVLASTLAREIQSFVRDGARHDYMVSLTGVVRQ